MTEDGGEKCINRRQFLAAGVAAGGAIASAQNASADPILPTNPDEYDASVYDNCTSIRGGDLGLAVVTGQRFVADNIPTLFFDVDQCWQEDAEQAEDDLGYYSNALDIKQKNDEQRVAIQNNLTGVANAATKDAKIAFANAYLEGKGLSSCHGEAITAAQDRLSAIQENALTSWHTTAIALNRLRLQTALNNDIEPDGFETDPVFSVTLYNRNTGSYEDILERYDPHGSTTHSAADNSTLRYTEEEDTFELVNGEEISFRVLAVTGDNGVVHDGGAYDDTGAYYGPHDSHDDYYTFSPLSQEYGNAVMATRPNATEPRELARTWDYSELIEAAADAYDVVTDRLGTEEEGYLHKVYQHLENGVISIAGPAEDSFLSANEWAEMTLQDEDIGTRSWYDAAMSDLGVGGLTGETSATLTIHEESELDGAELDNDFKVEGNIYSDYPPTTDEDGNPEWITGETYDTANFGDEDDGGVITVGHYVEQGDGSLQYTRMVVEGTFTLNSLQNTDTGEEIDSAAHTDRTQDTADATQYEKDMEEIEKELERLNEIADSDPGREVNINVDLGIGWGQLDDMGAWVWLIPGAALVIGVLGLFGSISGD